MGWFLHGEWTVCPTTKLRPGGKFPPELLMRSQRTNETRHYVLERTARIMKVPRQSHVALGHYECGGCGAVVDPQDVHCRRCGARLERGKEMMTDYEQQEMELAEARAEERWMACANAEVCDRAAEVAGADMRTCDWLRCEGCELWREAVR